MYVKDGLFYGAIRKRVGELLYINFNKTKKEKYYMFM